MNPTFFAFQKAVMQASINMFMGIEHTPKPKKPAEDGKLFARSDMVTEAEEAQEAAEKELRTRKYLDDLAEEVRNRNEPQGPTPEDIQLKGG